MESYTHDLLAVLDGGTALAERFRVYIADEDGNVFGDDNLHETFMEFLLDTGRTR